MRKILRLKEFAEGQQAFREADTCTYTIAPYKRRSIEYAFWDAGWRYEKRQLEEPGVIVGPIMWGACDEKYEYCLGEFVPCW